MMELTEEDLQPQVSPIFCDEFIGNQCFRWTDVDQAKTGIFMINYVCSLTTPRDEKDKVIICSGIENGVTFGTPIWCMVNNEDVKKKGWIEIRLKI
jgi:hypothetical protein